MAFQRAEDRVRDLLGVLATVVAVYSLILWTQRWLMQAQTLTLWLTPLAVGCYALLRQDNRRRLLAVLLIWGIVLFALAWSLITDSPFATFQRSLAIRCVVALCVVFLLNLTESLFPHGFCKFKEERLLMSMIDELRTGDVVMTTSIETFSHIIKIFTRSGYSHAAVIIRDPSPEVRKAYHIDGPKFADCRVFVLESEVSLFCHDKELPDVVTSRLPCWSKKSGTQMLPIEVWLDCYYAWFLDFKPHRRLLQAEPICVVRQLVLPEGAEPLPNIDEFLIRAASWKYEFSKLRQVKGALALDSHRDTYRDLRKLGATQIEIMRATPSAGSTKAAYCSQLVALVYQELNLLKWGTSGANLMPRNFSSEKSGTVELLQGAKWGPEIRIMRRKWMFRRRLRPWEQGSADEEEKALVDDIQFWGADEE